MQFSLQPLFTSFLLVPNTPLSALYSKTLSLCSCPIVRNQVSHPYKATEKTEIPHILKFLLLNSKLEDKSF